MIDYELLEDLVISIDEEGEAGAVLVFLPVSVTSSRDIRLFYFSSWRFDFLHAVNFYIDITEG